MAEGRARLWIVDDEPADHELIKIGFEGLIDREDFESFANAEAALDALLDGARPSLILLDLKMPGMGGFGLLKARRDRKLGSVPMVVYSSSADPDDVEAAYDLGANAYVEKPKDLDGLNDFAISTSKFWFEWAHLPSE